MDLQTPDEFVDEFTSLVPFSSKVVGTLSEISRSSSFSDTHNSMCAVSLPKCYSNKLFAPDEMQHLHLLYSKLYSLNQIGSNLSSQAYHRYQTMYVISTPHN